MKYLYTFLTLALFFSFQPLLARNRYSKAMDGVFRPTAAKENLSSRLEWQFMRSRDPYTNRIPANISILERRFAETLPTDRMQGLRKGDQVFSTAGWTLLGPFNQGGRSRALEADVSNPNVLLAGGATGGMWRSTDNGTSWTKVTPAGDTVQTVTCVTQDMRQGKTNIWYYGTGEFASNLELPGNGAGFTTFLGGGVFKSTDDGVTWNRLQSTMPGYSPTFVNPFQIVWDIAVDTSNHSQDVVYAAVFGGIYRSTDGGGSWVNVLGDTSQSTYTDVAVTGAGDAYAALSNGSTQGIWHSTDGDHWTDITPASFPAVYGRIVIAVAPSNPNVLYALANTPGSGMSGDPQNGTDDYHSLYEYSATTGAWTNLTDNLPSWSGNVGGYSSQDGYDMVIKVSPADSNLVIIGGTNLYRTTDGFRTQLDSTDWIGGYSPANDISSYPNQHPDEHDIFFLPGNPRVVYSSNDGGLSYTADVTASPVQWTSLNNGFTTTQFYSVALDHATPNSPFIVGGMQDNGNMADTTWSANSSWVELPNGGDGGIAAVADGASYFYFETQNGSIYETRTSDGSEASVQPASAGGFMFTTPYVLDPTDTKIMYEAAGTQIWRNSDLMNIPLGGDSATTVGWTDFTNVDTSGQVTALAVSRNPEHILYYGTADGNVFRVDSADQGNPASLNVTGSSFPPGFVSSIAIDPSNANNVMVDFSNYDVLSIFYSTDGGNSWQAVSGNLEQNPDGSGNGPSVRCVNILDNNGSKVYYAGTSTGLYATTSLNGMNTVWVEQGADNIGMIDVESVDCRDTDGTVVAGTFGNGVYGTKVTATAVQSQKKVPIAYELDQNYPNPFNPTTTIRYQLASEGRVSVKVYDVLGQQVATLADGVEQPGVHRVVFNGAGLASGVYFYKIVAEGNGGKKFVSVMKMLELK